jgi:RNA polymerase sigma factor (sigma-70 family)
MSVALSYGVVMAPWPVGRQAVCVEGDPDAGAVARCKAGDEAAFEALVARHEGELYRLCLRLLGNRDDAIEATQETFLRIVRALPRFRGEAAFRTWAWGIALNVCRNRVKTVAARIAARSESFERESSEGEPVALPIPDAAPNPEARAYGSELRHALQRALVALSVDHREILVLREIEGLDYDALAELLGCAEGTVKSRLARARAALREALAGVWP